LPYAIIKSFSTMCLWETYPETPDDGPTVELDALAVVAGRTLSLWGQEFFRPEPLANSTLVAAATRILSQVAALHNGQSDATEFINGQTR